MASEDAEIQCQSTSTNQPGDSAASYGLAPFVASVSIASHSSVAGTTVSSGAIMLAQSAASHTPPQNVAVQPSVAPSPLPHVQVIQQPLQNQYLQQLYAAPQQQHMFLPGNLTLQPTIQSISTPAGISLQLQGKGIENKGAAPTIISAAPMQTVRVSGQSGFIPTTSANQALVIGQLSVLSNPQSVLPHQAKLADGQKGKSFLISQPSTLHPKSPLLPSPNVSSATQMIATNQLKQLSSAPHIITTQAPTMITNQAQLLGSLQALGMPPGITWATPSLHSSALFGQNPIFIRSQQSDMFIQSPPPQAIHAVPVTPAALQQAQQQQAQQQQQLQQHAQQQAQQQQTQQVQQQQAQQQQQQLQQHAQQQVQQQTQQQVQSIQQQQTQQQQVQLQSLQQQQIQQQQAQQQTQLQVQQTQPQQQAIPQQQQIQLQQQVQQQQQQIIQQSVQQQHQAVQQQQSAQQPQQQVQQIQPSPQQTILPAPQVSTSQSYKPKPISIKPMRPGSSVGTQTTVSTSTSTSTSTSNKTQSKSRSRLLHCRTITAPTNSAQSQTATTQTQTQPPPSKKADAANQTKPVSEPKLASIYNKILEPFNKSAATETAFSPSVPEPIEVDIPQAAADSTESASLPDVAIVAPSPAVPLVDEGIQMDMVEESASEASTPSSSDNVHVESISCKKDMEADNVGIVMPMTDMTNVKEKVLQKAIVKPHVLTHVIEGFVIQEGSEPFPVSLPSYSINNEEEIIEKAAEPVSESYSIDGGIIRKKDKIPKIRGGPVELAKCEFCGKLGPKAKFKRSKRFCSTSCAKRFAAGISKRLSIILPDQDPITGEEIRKHKKKGNSKKGSKSKKKKLGLKSKKSWKKLESRHYDGSEWNVHVVQDVQEEEMMEESIETPEKQVNEGRCMDIEDNSNLVTGEEEDSNPSSPAVVVLEDDGDRPPHGTEFATKSPLEWTVTDVVDFVRSMPGCSDYADEFRAQEIDGQALMLLKEDHLMSLMSMKLGPALKVCARIKVMREEMAH